MDKTKEFENYDYGEITYNNSLKLIDSNENIIKFKNADDKTFYFKNESSWFTEILTGKVANFFNIPVVGHKKASYNGFTGVISEDFHKEGYNYLNGEELIKEYFENHPEVKMEYANTMTANDLTLIWWALEDRYKSHPNKELIIKKLMEQFMSIYEFSIITGQVDMHNNNYQIEENEQDANLAPLYDNAMSFMNNPVTALSLEKEDNCTTVKDSIKKYFNIVTGEQREVFMEKVNSLTINVLNNMMEEIINNIKLSKEELKDVYFEKKNIIKAFLQNKRIIILANNEYMSNRIK